MTRRKKIMSVIAIVLVVAIGSLAFALSYDAGCAATSPPAAGTALMKSVVARCYGGPDVLRVEEIARPTPGDDQLLVRVHAASLNPLDWHTMRGKPYVMRIGSGIGTPKGSTVGVDFAGTVEGVGKNVTRFKPGDAVFGGRHGALSEYVVVGETSALALKPANISFEQAASVYIAADTALQALRDHGGIQPGQKVLINGASGGVGTFAVQIAKSLGAEVTGVCSTRNVELVRSLGADHVVDYTQADFTASGQQYDLIVDNVATRSIADLRRALTPKGTLIIVGGAPGDWIGPFGPPLKAMVVSKFVDQKMQMMIASPTQADMQLLAELMQSGKVTPVVDRTYPLTDAPEAMRYLEAGRARGKVVVTIGTP